MLMDLGFDLMGLHDTETMNLIREAINKSENGKDVIIYGEPWSAGPSNFKKGYKPATKDAIRDLNDGISIFNDDTRDAAKGKFNELESPGFVNGGVGFEERIKRAFLGLIDASYKEQPKQPNQIINYVSAHDNSTFWDKLVDSVKKNKDYLTKDYELLSMNKLGAAFVNYLMEYHLCKLEKKQEEQNLEKIIAIIFQENLISLTGAECMSLKI